MMKKLYIILLAITYNLEAQLFLQRPAELPEDEMAQLAAGWHTQFTWRFGMGCSFSCMYEHNESSFILRVCGIPVRSYNVPRVQKSKNKAESDAPQHGYYFARPLKYETPNPQKISVEELCSVLEYKRFIFYTGAGMSAAADVATMHDLEKSLMLTDGKYAFAKAIFYNAPEIAAAFSRFCESAIYGTPTPAHYAVRDIAVHKNVAIVTENVDLLQQRSGVKPHFSRSSVLYAAQPDDFKAVDAVVCVGLSHDDCGFLAHYKEQNPQGVIIAIDMKVPSYLSEKDFLLQADIAEALPALAHVLNHL